MARRKRKKRRAAPRRRARRRRNPKRRKGSKWIQKAKIKRGALTAKLKRWYRYRPVRGKKIPLAMLRKAKRRAQRTGDTRTMRQVNLALTFRGMAAKRKKRRKVVRGRFGVRRRRAAN